MVNMFGSNREFNQNIGSWTSKVTSMESIFNSATSFNQKGHGMVKSQ